MIYKGVLNPEKMTPLAKKGYIVWRRQRDRCLNKNSMSYKTYGAIGIKVEYSSREFVGWYLSNYIEGCDVGRIDHSKNYSLTNIEFQTRSQNTIERNNRLGLPKKIGKLVVYHCNGHTKIFKNIKSASEKSGYGSGYIKRLSSLKKATRKNERFTVMEKSYA